MAASSPTDFSVLKKEDGCPIYQTQVNPIQYSSVHQRTPISKHAVEGVEGAFVLDNVLSEEECKQFIDITEAMGYADAPITTYGGMILMKDVRDNMRVMWQTTEDTWHPIWERIKDWVPAEYQQYRNNWRSLSLNERFRFYRYEPGQVFQRHYDGAFPRNQQERSYLTFIIYLSDGFEGGHTTFYIRGQSPIKVQPKAGSALLFFHGNSPMSPEHEGSACKNGRKYVLRSDVMYRLDQ